MPDQSSLVYSQGGQRDASTHRRYAAGKTEPDSAFACSHMSARQLRASCAPAGGSVERLLADYSGGADTARQVREVPAHVDDLA